MGGTICRVTRPKEQVSRSLLNMPWFMVNMFIKAAERAEDILGHPPNALQIFRVMGFLSNAFQVAAVLTSLLREDLIFVDKNMYRWTVRKQEGYFSYSEIFF